KPDGDVKVPFEVINEVLRSVLVDVDVEEAVSIREDGTYKIGLLTGHAVPVSEVRFIGRNARKRYRESQIEQLTAEIDELWTERQHIQKTIAELKTNVQAAQDALDGFPQDDDLQAGYAQIKEKRFEMSQYEKELQAMDDQMNAIYHTYQD